MSDEPIISVENLGKKYRLKHQSSRPRYTTMRDVIAEKARHLFSRGQKSEVRSQTSRPISDLRPPTSVSRASQEDFWALKDVSFEVKRGEVVGIIGRNGAGKSTLLKILSRITEPTEGRVRLRGRVASLLEVGTGFHPELTGRENIFLNGAILGMSRAEIRNKFDEIVAFAEVERFLDTPVKHYSSGMYVRLAFAVAAHLEPEILIVDEVLAVGDADFQRKCLGKMQEVSRGGRTVLFVSHNMSAVTNLCSRAILLKSGCLKAMGDAVSVLRDYMTLGERNSSFAPRPGERFGDQQVRIDNFTVEPRHPATGYPVTFVFELSRQDIGNRKLETELAVSFCTEQGSKVLQLYSKIMGWSYAVPLGRSKIAVSIEAMPLIPGNYWLNLWAGNGNVPYDWVREAYYLTVGPGGFVEGCFVGNDGYPAVAASRWSIM